MCVHTVHAVSCGICLYIYTVQQYHAQNLGKPTNTFQVLVPIRQQGRKPFTGYWTVVLHAVRVPTINCLKTRFQLLEQRKGFPLDVVYRLHVY